MLHDGDSLFSNHQDAYSSEIQAITPSFHAYAESYRIAANTLLKEILKEGTHPYDLAFQAIPVVFLVRHYVELTLKAVLSEYDDLKGSSGIKKKQHHCIKDIWRDVKPLLGEMGIHQDAEQVEVADKLIEEIDAYDPYSFSFRYPHGKTSSKPLLAGVERINLANLNDVYQRLQVFLGNILVNTCNCATAYKNPY